MEDKEQTRHNILKINKDSSLSANTKEFNYVLTVLQDTNEEFPVHKGKLHVKPQNEQECIKQHYDDKLRGYLGVNKTMELIQRNFTFLLMRQKVAQYIKKCVLCQQNKAARHAKYGHIQLNTLLAQPWDEVTMDFIVKLPLSNDHVTKEVYNSILIIVDRLTKYTHFIPYKEAYTAEQLA